MARNGEGDLIESIMHQLIDEEALGVAFEMHRAIKLGYYELVYPDESSYEKHDVVDVKGYDIFGNTPQSLQKNVDCQCPNCDRTLGAAKFAPHLEKCMGMGRNSTRLANRKNNRTPVESDQEGGGGGGGGGGSVRSEEEDEWVYPERRASKKARRDKHHSSPLRSTSSRSGPGRPPKNSQPSLSSSSSSNSTLSLKPSLQQHNVASFMTLPSDYKITLMQQICGVVSERTGRLCTRSVNCPQHTEEQRQSLRRKLLDRPIDLPISSQKRRRERERVESPDDDDDVIGGNRRHSPSDSPPPPAPPPPPPPPPQPSWNNSSSKRRSKNKSGKRPKKSGHSSSGGNSTMSGTSSRPFSTMF